MIGGLTLVAAIAVAAPPGFQRVAFAEPAPDDLDILVDALGNLDDSDRAVAEVVALQRLEAVVSWRALVEARTVDPSLDPDARLRLSRELERLAAEERIWRAQLAELAPSYRPVALQAFPTSPQPYQPARRDVVAWFDTIVVERGDRVRHAIAIGGDVVVLGQVERHATSLGGDVRLVPGGRVEGRRVAWAGRVDGMGAEAAAPVPGNLALASGLMGLMGFATVAASASPAAVQRVATEARLHPLASLVAGALAALSLGALSILGASLVAGPWVVVLTLLTLALTALLGSAGLLVALGELVLTPRSAPTLGLGLVAALVVSLTLLAIPTLLHLVLLATAAAGIGAVLRAVLAP